MALNTLGTLINVLSQSFSRLTHDTSFILQTIHEFGDMPLSKSLHVLIFDSFRVLIISVLSVTWLGVPHAESGF